MLEAHTRPGFRGAMYRYGGGVPHLRWSFPSPFQPTISNPEREITRVESALPVAGAIGSDPGPEGPSVGPGSLRAFHGPQGPLAIRIADIEIQTCTVSVHSQCRKPVLAGRPGRRAPAGLVCPLLQPRQGGCLQRVGRLAAQQGGVVLEEHQVLLDAEDDDVGCVARRARLALR